MKRNKCIFEMDLGVYDCYFIFIIIVILFVL